MKVQAPLIGRIQPPVSPREQRIMECADSFIRTRDEIRALPEIHDEDGRCSGHLRRNLPYAVVQCDDCQHVVRTEDR
jgi:hypothetical protein